MTVIFSCLEQLTSEILIMEKLAKKRNPHGVTSFMVLDALLKLHTKNGKPELVSRADLLEALSLPETTVDDSLRTMLKDGRVFRVGRAQYVPQLWHRRKRRPQLPGTPIKIYFPDGLMVEEMWSMQPWVVK
jgi:hypothetical protein